MKINEKVLKDLEFDTIRTLISQLCISDLAKEKALTLVPSKNSDWIKTQLNQSNEYLSSFENDNQFPRVEFEDITESLNLLEIENYYLEAPVCVKILQIALQSNDLLKFNLKFKEYYPALFQVSDQVEYTDEPIKLIHKVFNKFGEIKNDATPNLARIRKEINAANQNASGLFSKISAYYKKLGFLDDIRESVLDNKQVLAVKATFRKKVKGIMLGSSKTGSIIFVEPQDLIESNKRLQALLDDEKQEIIVILRALTADLIIYKPLFEDYIRLLTHFDFVRAKALLAKQLNACLPEINSEQAFELKQAYHPLLTLSNQEKNIETIAQDLSLHAKSRIIVISGPNAGGKSITLKTVGLLQLMLQSGLLIPVHFKSKACFFDKIFSDIGDNQSIENQLSTYSYRLKTMKNFLKGCNSKTLFLIDEFGTGSDPELGGALAEVFLEEFYQRKAFGIITTHYSNLKILVEDLEDATNACMLFDEHSLKPLYQLEVGQAGSSFTFEVAVKNGIPYSLINRAKKKIETGKVRLDKTIVKLQQQRSSVESSKRKLAVEKDVIGQKNNEIEILKNKLQSRLESFHTLYEKQSKILSLGKKVDQLANTYRKNKAKQNLIKNFLKLVEIENSKKEKIKTKAEIKIQKLAEKEIEREIKKEMPKVEITVQKQETQEAIQIKKRIANLKKGDRVKIKDSASVGTIDKIEKKKAFINYGFFSTQVDLDQLIKV